MIGSPMQTVGERGLTALGIAVLVGLVVLVRVTWSFDRSHSNGMYRAWRRLNMITAALVVLVAIDLLPDLVDETEWSHRADEVAIALLAGLAIVWYVVGRGRLRRSLAPLAIAVAAEVVKVAAVAVEWRDTADVQGDIVVALLGLPVLTVLGLLYLQMWRRGSLEPA